MSNTDRGEADKMEGDSTTIWTPTREELFAIALRDLSRPVPSTKGMDPKAKALRLHAELTARIAFAVLALKQAGASDASETAVRRWRAHEKAYFALNPILEREDLETVSAGELADAAIAAFEKAMGEPLPKGWAKYVTDTPPRQNLGTPTTETINPPVGSRG